MPRHTSFRFCLDPSVEQERVLSRHVGAARFAFNQALRLHKDAYATARRGQGEASGAVSDGDHPGGDRADRADGVPGEFRVPWTGFDLISAFNGWKRSQAAGRRFLVDENGVAEVEVTGLAWRGRVLQPPPPLSASGVQPAGQDPRPAGPGRPEHHRHDEEPQALPRHQ